jgi:hypothetical protein
MKGIFYTTTVFESSLDIVHGFGTDIFEIFIPELKICFNNLGYAFHSEDIRKPKTVFTEVELSSSFVTLLQEKIKLEEIYKDHTSKLFESLNKQLNIT